MAPDHGGVDAFQVPGQAQVVQRPRVPRLEMVRVEHVVHPPDEEDNLLVASFIHGVDIREVLREPVPESLYLRRIVPQQAMVAYPP